MPYLTVAFAAGFVIAVTITRFIFYKFNRHEETELKEAKRLLRVRENQRDEYEEMTETMGERIDYLESEVKRLKGYETAVRELNRSVEILAEDVPF